MGSYAQMVVDFTRSLPAGRLPASTEGTLVGFRFVMTRGSHNYDKTHPALPAYGSAAHRAAEGTGRERKGKESRPAAQLRRHLPATHEFGSSPEQERELTRLCRRQKKK
jgi:hypothetical protein